MIILSLIKKCDCFSDLYSMIPPHGYLASWYQFEVQQALARSVDGGTPHRDQSSAFVDCGTGSKPDFKGCHFGRIGTADGFPRDDVSPEQPISHDARVGCDADADDCICETATQARRRRRRHARSQQVLLDYSGGFF